MIGPSVATRLAMEIAETAAFGLFPCADLTVASGQPKRQHSCMQPMRDARGIWQFMPMRCLAMGQCGAQGRADAVPMLQVRPARAGSAVSSAMASTATSWRSFFIRLRETIHRNALEI